MSKQRYRLVVLGSGKVGKTSIIRRYLNGTFDEKYKETVEDLYSKNVDIQGMKISLDILDTNFAYPDMRKVAVASADALMLVFSVNDVPSFKQMSDIWSEIVQQRKDARSLPTVVVGNKSDLITQKIFEATAQAWTQRLNSNVRYVEASAKTAHNIAKIFRNFLEQSSFLNKDVTALPSCPFVERHADDLAKTLVNMKVSDHSSTEKRTEKQKPRPGDHFSIQMLHRNWSLRVKTSKDSEIKSFNRPGSFRRRSKHLSLRMKHPEKEISVTAEDENDCKIS